MGILNINDDSFYTGSRYNNETAVLQAAEKMLQDGAIILDVGGQSTRPGSQQISAEKELARVLPAIETLYKHFPQAYISIDSFYSKVIAEAVAAGASIINDISAGQMDENYLETVAALQVPYILMHMQGTPRTMQQQAQYVDVTKDVLDFFIKKMALLQQKNITDIIIDPGFGFGKTIAHNFELLKNLSVFKILKCPLLLGISRKSTIYKTLGIEAEEALNGTTVLHTIGLLNGANILRVHDVKEAAEAIKLVGAYQL